MDVTIGYVDRDLAAGRAEPSLGALLLARRPSAQPLHVAVRFHAAGELPDSGDAAAVSAWIGGVFEEKVGAWTAARLPL